jgi:hypothetical protein
MRSKVALGRSFADPEALADLAVAESLGDQGRAATSPCRGVLGAENRCPLVVLRHHRLYPRVAVTGVAATLASTTPVITLS